MTTTYTSPGTSSKDMVRFLIGDTNQAVTWQITDEEIISVLATYAVTDEAAAECADHLAARYTALPSTSTGGVSLGAERAAGFRQLALALRKRASERVANKATGFVGGRLISERDDLAADSTVVQPAFTVNQHDHPSVENAEDEEEVS